MSAWLKFSLIVIQLIDIAIHVAIDQVEPIRVLSNLIIIGWVATFWFARSWVESRKWAISLSAISLYLLLNLIFLAQNGLTNPHNGDAPRTALFIFVILTCALSLYSAGSSSSRSNS